MRTTRNYKYLSLIVVALLIFAPLSGTAAAQGNSTKRPIDMVIMIDNSCSMFPANQIRANCDSFGSDPTFLRITGSDLFVARLGFSEQNEADYQLGVIGFGDEPSVISPLQPIKDIRDAVAAKIAHPLAQPATRLIPAIQKSYELIKGSSKYSQNLPAVVLITDGVPWPREGQGNADIDKLISANQDIPLFIMLLQNKTKTNADYEDYIKFWEQIQSRLSNIFVFKISDASQIADTYNQILGQLQSTVPSKGIDLQANKPAKFFVNQYIQKLIVTVVRKDNNQGTVTILDPAGKAIKLEDPGVVNFRGKENPIEVYSLGSPRLQDSLKGKTWTISSTSDATIFVDRDGAYRINFISPSTQPIDITNYFQALERQTPSKEFVVHFNLIDAAGKPILEPQSIHGSVITPGGGAVNLPTLASVKPDSSGLYEFKYDLATAYPNIVNQTGRFTFIFNAGLTDEQTKDFIPVTFARLIIDVGLIPYVRSIAPLPVSCEANQPFELRVNIGDYSTAAEDSLKVSVLYGTNSIVLEPKGSGVYGSDLSPFCGQMIAKQSCSDQQLINLVVQLDANSTDGTPLAPVTKEIQAQIISPKCTPTPVPTETPTLAPTPTPTPDPALTTCGGVRAFPGANGCLPWNMVLWGAGILGIVVVSSVWVWPWVRVRTVSEPPAGYLLICKQGKVQGKPISLFDIGKSHRTDKILLGSQPRATIVVPGLKSVEFIFERKSVLTTIKSEKNEPFAYLDDTVKIIRTSDPKTILKVSTDQNKLTC